MEDAKLTKLWNRLDQDEQDLIFYVSNAPPPVSIDILGSLAKLPALKVLNIMEGLRKRKVVCEKKEYGRGIYFLNDDEIHGFIQTQTTQEATERNLRNILQHYRETLHEGPDKTLILADLYQKLGSPDDGMDYIKDAADILSSSGQKEKAAAYYSYLLSNLSEKGVTLANADDFLAGALNEVSAAGHLLPSEGQMDLLNRARDVARRFEKWDALAKITLSAGQVLKDSGEHDKAVDCFNEAWQIADTINNQEILRVAALSISDLLFSRGRISEAIERYEKVVGNREEFGDDEATLRARAMLGYCYTLYGRISRGMGMIGAVKSKAQTLQLRDLLIYADLMMALSMIEIHKVSDAEQYLQNILVIPPDTVDHRVRAAAYGCMAYLLCLKKEYEGAFEHHKKAIEEIRLLGPIHSRGFYNFEYLYMLEKKGFIHDEMDYDSEIARTLKGHDIYMKGVAFRYRALKNIKVRESKGRAFLDLRSSEKYLGMAGAEIELARTRIALGDAYLKEGEIKVALSYLEKAWAVFSKIDKNLFPKDLLVIMMPQEQKIEFMIDRIININESLATIRDMSAFLERVINLAMDFTMAMRGAFFTVRPGKEPAIVASRNLDPLLLKIEQFALIKDVVANVAREDTEATMPGLKVKGVLADTLLASAGISSLICMPARLGEDTHGYLYLDSHLGGEPFPNNHLPHVRLLCNQIAVGLSNIRIYEEMRGLKDRFEDEAIFYKREMGIAAPTEMIVGTSERIKTVIEQIRQVAPADSSVLILGETGVGKELVAKAIHNLSQRKDGPFIPVNLAALPHDLVASELFGHEKGAFTGASEKYKGRFELANGGTIFLDEIADLPLNVQVKLLRVLQEGTFERLGSAQTIRSDFRVIAATNKNPAKEVEKGAFRQDLYYRLNVFPIYVPPLRDRKEDIHLIATHFLEKFSKKMGKKIKGIPQNGMRMLLDYGWPGNVRELEHFIERAVILTSGNTINLPGFEHSLPSPISVPHHGSVPLADMERSYIEKILNSTHWRVSGPSGAAAILGMKPTTLISRMKKLGIKKPFPIAG